MFLYKFWKSLSLEIYNDKIAKSGVRVIHKALQEAQDRNHNHFDSEHIFFAIAELEEPLFVEVMQRLNLDPQAIFDAFDTHLDSGNYSGQEMKMSESLRTLLASAVKNARSERRRLAQVQDFFIASFQEEKSFPSKFFQQCGVESATAIQIIRDCKHLIGLHDREPYTSKLRRRPRNNEDKNEGNCRIIIGNKDFNQ